MKFRRQYADPIGDEALGLLTGIDTGPDSPTEQHHKDECDIPLMLKRLGVDPDRSLPVVTVSNIIKDVTLLPDTLLEAFEIIDSAQRSFRELPAGVRAYFGNDPRRFVAASEDELIAAGIPERAPAPAPAPGAAPAAEAVGGESAAS